MPVYLQNIGFKFIRMYDYLMLKDATYDYLNYYVKLIIQVILHQTFSIHSDIFNIIWMKCFGSVAHHYLYMYHVSSVIHK